MRRVRELNVPSGGQGTKFLFDYCAVEGQIRIDLLQWMQVYSG